MVREENTTALTDKQSWFEYAYYSSAATFEAAEDGAVRAKPLRLQ